MYTVLKGGEHVFVKNLVPQICELLTLMHHDELLDLLCMSLAHATVLLVEVIHGGLAT